MNSQALDRTGAARPSRQASRLRAATTGVIAGLAAGLVGGLGACAPAQASPRLPPPVQDVPASTAPQVAILSGGCFWGTQGVFEHVKGVTQVLAGYDGGARASANYEAVSTGTTGHAESIRVTFDPRQITYGQILRIFFSVATDPTQINRQYPDEGPQYRSEVFYRDAAQKAVAERYIAELDRAKAFSRPIATRVGPDTGFYRAEGYHQNYLVHHPDAPYIATFDLPKVAALKAAFPAEYRASPVLAL